MAKKCSFLILSHHFTKLALNKTLPRVGERKKSFQKKEKPWFISRAQED
jgi:hypothetical protein